jgi:hypothetical protein
MNNAPHAESGAGSAHPDAVHVRSIPPDSAAVRSRDVIELGESREAALDDLTTLALRAGAQLTGYTMRSSARIVGDVLGRFAASGPGRITRRVLGAMVGEPASHEVENPISWAIRATEEQLTRVITVVVPIVVHAVDVTAVIRDVDVDAVIDQVDVNGLLDRVDVDRLLRRVDVDALLDRVDVDRFMEQVDVNALMARVDLDGLMARVDLDALMASVDIDALVSRVDVNALMERVDVDGLLDRVDVDAVVDRVDVQSIVASSTGEVAGSALDIARRQTVGVDFVVSRTVNRLLGRDPSTVPVGPPELVDDEETEE